ncbi:hypothetical protein KDF03_004714 [Escherichia coli]|uniref:DUF5677 domain-containing protein n=1 Tax=Escherichia coli TaxID=562 RepID=UPI000BE5F13D|nr:DUF5677 domain-containing protein [Escherichia coli]EEC9332449.1 hypothetical protein [Escherichia coli]EED1425435.1 hypothetical protein [Escherichia coli]EEQ1963505.1 hypothetical protein [Escherichia coli]EEQ2552260.1 hypothetical protein [Escherichia coli]EEQ3797209.1 hypothetical protein [Escherichia coli]
MRKKSFGRCPFDFDEDVKKIAAINKYIHAKFERHKDKIDNLKGVEQKLMVLHYFNVLNELSNQAIFSLSTGAFSASEVLTRVIMEQAANQFYIAIDDGKNAQALLKGSKKLVHSNGKRWLECLKSKEMTNPAADERIRIGKELTDMFNRWWPNTPEYPGTKKLFEVIGWETHYHAYYVPLCDSIHTFSDDMANIVSLYNAIQSDKTTAIELTLAVKQENKRLAIYNVVIAIGLRCEALVNVFNSLGYRDIITEMAPTIDAVNQIIIRYDDFEHSRIFYCQ